MNKNSFKISISERELKIVLISSILISVVLGVWFMNSYRDLKSQVDDFQVELQAIKTEQGARALSNEFIDNVRR